MTRFRTPLLLVGLAIIASMSAIACAGEEVVREVIVEVPVEKEVIKEVVVEKEVPVEVEVVKEVEVERIVEKIVQAEPEKVAVAGWLLRAPEPTPRYGGVVKTAWPNKLDHYDFHQGNIAYSGLTSFYNQLTYFNQADGYRTIAPDLAASWDVSSDGTTYTFNLREGVLWSDGSDFTADDVLATFDRILDPPEGKGLTIINTVNFEMVDAVTAPDSHTVVFDLKRATPWFMEVMSFDPHFGPPNIYQKQALIDNDWNLREVWTSGTGLWDIKEEQPGEFYLLEPNPLHFNPNVPYPDFHRMFHVPVWADRGAAVLTNQADWSWNVSYDTWVEGAKHPDIAAGTRPSFGGGLGVHINQNKDKGLPYADPKVVKAMFLAFDQPRFMAVVEAAFKPSRLQGWLPLSNPAALTPEELAKIPGYRADKSEDLPEAKRLMAEAGYPDGFKGTLTCINPALQAEVLCPEMQAQFKGSLNIDLELIIVDRSGVGDIYTSGDWEFFYGAPPIGVRLSDPTPNWLTEAVCDAEKNYRGYCNPELDDVVMTLLDEFDPIKRNNLFAKARDLLNEQPPGLLGGANQALPLWWKFVKGHALSPPGHVFIQWGRFDTEWLDKPETVSQEHRTICDSRVCG
jgi:peptide/nickel transport system substrate-binding protein